MQDRNNYFEFKGINIRLSFSTLFTHCLKKASKSDVDIVENKEV